jgi:UDP-N-acetylmuramoyl-tripeptide--D-alanyl-D-alanine ligase
MSYSEPASVNLYLVSLLPLAVISIGLAVAAHRRPPGRPGMIPLSLGEIAAVVGGTVEGDGAVTPQALAAHVVARLRGGLTGSQPQRARP